MHKLHRISALLGVTLFLASASFGGVKTDYDRSANFNNYKTFSWGSIQTKDPLWVSRIKMAVDAALEAKGLTPVESGGDVTLMAMEMTHDHQTLNTYYDGLGGGWGWRWGGGFGEATTTDDVYKVGTLVVDMFDSSNKQLVWRGSASDTLSDKSSKNIKNLDKGVDKLFDHFLPGEKK